MKEYLLKTVEETAELKGILSEIRVTQGPKKISLVGPEGKIPVDYHADMEGELIKYLIKRVPVKISGKAVINSEGRIMKLQGITGMDPFDEVIRSRIISGETEIKLRNPFKMRVGYEDDMWVMSNDSLGIHTTSKDYQQCLNEAEEEFIFIVKEYLDAPDEELTRDAIDLKCRVKELLE